MQSAKKDIDFNNPGNRHESYQKERKLSKKNESGKNENWKR